jgi:hypothetical protein
MGDDRERAPTAAPPGEAPPDDPGGFLRTVVAPAFARQVQDLRGRITTLQRELAEREGAEASIGIRVGGDGGGTWYLNVRGGAMEVATDAAGPVLFMVHQTIDDWRALASRGTMLGGKATGMAGRGALTKSRIARLRQLAGTMRLVLKDGEASRQVTLHFGKGEPIDPPHTTVSMHEEDARNLRDGSLDPQTAFMQGRVAVSGDMTFALGLGTALFL